jgi:catechol 2,3-dioxygenase-like lactoylglutathione lyase family enzyme
MPVNGIAVHVADLARSAGFYTRFLGAEVAGETPGATRLALPGGVIDLLRLPDGAAGWPVPPTDDSVQGFWHIGLYVDNLDEISDAVRDYGAGFFIEPVDNLTAEVRCSFFYDPDGVTIELVQGTLKYTDLLDPEAAAARRALPVSPPRFDHVAFTVPDYAAAKTGWEMCGFREIGTLALPDDPRGSVLHYLTDGGDLVIEVFDFQRGVKAPRPQDVARGFGGLLLPEPLPAPLGFKAAWVGPTGLPRFFDAAGLAVVVG